MVRQLRTFLIVFGIAILLVSSQGCGTGEKGIHRPPLDTTDTRSRNLYELAGESRDLSRFVAALEKTGLNDMLEHEGPFTIFAPSDGAFSRAGLRDTLLPGGRDSLRKLLEMHMVRGRYGFYPIKDSMVVGTVSDQTLTLRKPSQRHTLTVNKEPVLRYTMGQNGVLYVIRKVLIPAKPDTAATDTTKADSLQARTNTAPAPEH